MRFALKEYQKTATKEVLKSLLEAKDLYRKNDRRISFALSATTGSGKTVIATAVFEALFEGSDEFDFEADPSAVVLWVTDDPSLNEQTRHRIKEAGDRVDQSRLKVISDADFNQEKFEKGNVYFLNIQKLYSSSNLVNYVDKRTYTLWDTIRNTIENKDLTLYLVLDEAHKGMKTAPKQEEDRSSTVQRLINGQNGVPAIPAIPIVWGISATVDRFNKAMLRVKNRITLPNVEVDPKAVQDSGLLKDTIILNFPEKSQALETVLIGEATAALLESSELWKHYAQQESMPDTPQPLLVLQVPNKPSQTDMIRLLDSIWAKWPTLPSEAVAHVFGGHTEQEYGKYTVPYIAPQDVQDATHVRVLLAKDAISTGWDCPRAEVLFSLRPAVDRTNITQLLGRMVRTPLARRIDSDERLNAVTCYLPYFDRTTAKDVVDILTGVKKDKDDPNPLPPGRRILISPDTMLWNKSLPDGIAELFATLPSKAAPKAPSRPISRLLALAAAIGVDGLMDNANVKAHEKLFAVLDGQMSQHKPVVDAGVKGILSATIIRDEKKLLTKESKESMYTAAADVRAVDDTFRAPTRMLGEAVAKGYCKRLALTNIQDDEDFDPLLAKARIAALMSVPEVREHVDTEADKVAGIWFGQLNAKIKGLSEERRSIYAAIKQQARDPKEIDLVVPKSRIENTKERKGDEEVLLPTKDRHLLSNAQGEYPVGNLNDWERRVIDTELGRSETVAWYRNPSTQTMDALQVPWKDGEVWKSMQPDFIFFSTKADGSLVASIVDPHGYHLADALPKLCGLANFAEEHGAFFMRIEAVTVTDKNELRMLDMTLQGTRRAVLDAETAQALYLAAGEAYA